MWRDALEPSVSADGYTHDREGDPFVSPAGEPRFDLTAIETGGERQITIRGPRLELAYHVAEFAPFVRGETVRPPTQFRSFDPGTRFETAYPFEQPLLLRSRAEGIAAQVQFDSQRFTDVSIAA